MQKKSTERKPVTSRITPQCHEFLSSIWDRPGTGAGYILDALPGLYLQTIKEISGVFTAKELYLMVDVMNGTMLSGSIAGQHIIGNVLDGMHYESLDVKWEISREEIAGKLQELSLSQRACLELFVQGFWSQYNDDTAVSLEDYVRIIAVEDG